MIHRRVQWRARPTLAAFFFALAVASSSCTKVDDPTLARVADARFSAPEPTQRERGYAPHRNVFFGDLHIHTAYSFDAYTMGVRALPDDAYTYAKGGTIQHGAGYPIRALQPLDFAAVTDHAEYLGVARSRGVADPEETTLADVLKTGIPWRITWHFLRTTFTKMSSNDTRHATFDGGKEQTSIDAWNDIIAAAERHNAPGRFTTFVAYEWSSMPDEDNLHRNVVYRSAAVPKIPFSSLDSEDPADLWSALETQRAQGMDVFAIPHNSNVSNGRMYARETLQGRPLTKEYAKRRMRNEPVSEIFQVKGSSETHPILSSEDEFAGFEIYDTRLSAKGDKSQPSGSYARDALRSGLELSAHLGFNPYRFGFIGSSDSHNASSSVEENNYHGKLPLLDGTIGIRLGKTLLLPDNQNRGLQWSAAGLAAVWAEENTRDSLFDAMQRKETYATSGPRITVRLFAGWDFDEHFLDQANAIEEAYAKGVPMGGDLPPAPKSPTATPRLLVIALKDPIGANLDRIQIVKGWVDRTGQSQERIYDVAASDGRSINPATHRVAPLRSTVDVERATYENTTGAAQLQTVWVDPNFNPKVEAFYYARVIEIPTPRWSTYDAVALGVTPPSPGTLQERAVTSAIWYRPS